MKTGKWIAVLAMMCLVMCLFGCAANNEMYLSSPAGFWAGLWHGLICIVTFIISLFTGSVGIYEVNNSGTWYDFGFILGAVIALGHGGMWNPVKKKVFVKCEKEKEWEQIGRKVEEKVRTGIGKWVAESGEKEDEWEEIGKKIEEKIKRELRNWAEK